jgi:1-phosphofructokinase
MDVSPIKTAGHTGVIVQDRRSGDRVMLAQSAGMRLQRHDIDDAYGRLLEHALTSSMCVVTGQSSEIVPTDVYRRLGHDLRSGGVTVVADLHGPELWAFLEGGPIDLLKVSDEDLAGGDLLSRADADFGECRRGMDRLVDAGVRSIVLSRQHRPALARFGSQLFEAQVPKFDPADHRGAGDSMTAGLTAATIQGKSIVETLRLGCAAGAANVTRHGLGNANGDLIASLVERVVVKELSPSSL